MIIADSKPLADAFKSDALFHDRSKTWFEECLSGRLTSDADTAALAIETRSERHSNDVD